jgi:outer membrane protein assembly factor BamB
MVALVLCASGCATWAQSRDDQTRTGGQGLEFWIDAANVSTLAEHWRADLGDLTEDGLDKTSPTIVHGIAYAGDYGNLVAFDASGTKDCTGTPRTCSPLWSYPTAQNVITSTPAIADGVVYLASAGTLYAFDADGQDGCFGTPKTCLPLWTATDAFDQSSPAVVHGLVYVGTYDGHLDAFDAAGTTGCFGVPRTCTPVWRGDAGTGVQAAPAVAGGTVFVASTDGTVYEFDAAGHAGCSGDAPRTCTPLRTAPTGRAITVTPAVADGTVYVASAGGRLSAFDATGAVGCTGVPSVCAALWTADVGARIVGGPAVADGTVYVNDVGRMNAFDAAGTTGCGGTPKTCAPIWRTDAATEDFTNGQAPTVANGVVYVDGAANDLVAFDATGTTNCSGSAPRTCSPLWVSPKDDTGDGAIVSDAAIVNAAIYVIYFEHNRSELRAYSLPPN